LGAAFAGASLHAQQLRGFSSVSPPVNGEILRSVEPMSRPHWGPTYKALQESQKVIVDRCGNDPSAGSPTETLLRLHLPLNDKV
jgi:hypothetical protein